MAVIDCPACGTKVSDKAETCSNCGFNIKNADADQIARKQSLRRYEKLQGLQNQSLGAMLVFILGFGFMYWGDVAPGDTQHNLAIGAAIIGFIWYIVTRVRIVIVKRFSS